MVNAEQVQKVASLARLKLTDSELENARRQLAGILDYVAVLDEVDVSGVEPMAHGAEVANVFRPDDIQPGLSRTEALANAPRTDGRFFLVPQILENT